MSKTGIRGYKVFDPDWTWQGKRYTCPGKFEENIILSMCNRGMSFYKPAVCFDYFDLNRDNKVAEVIAYGNILDNGSICYTDKLKIVREVSWTELFEIVNSGNFNGGIWNSGSWNSGCRNSGSWNSGSCNSGSWNIGDCNSGDSNIGCCNSGDSNIGSWNSGSWNKCSFSNGCFNTTSSKIYLFDKPSEWTYEDWLSSEACYLLNQIPKKPVDYIMFSEMTDEEKKAHPEAEITGGYLKVLDNSRCAVWWRELSGSDKDIITSIPNFDKEIFMEITGIDVDKD